MRIISGTARGIRLKTPNGLRTRPTSDRVKEAVFSAIQFEVEGSRFLDLFAGTGQMGIEALSRGASETVFVDEWRDACQLVSENLRLAKFINRGRVIQSDYLRYLHSCTDRFDIVFLDPPYGEKYLEEALINISEIDILSERGIIICERPADKLLNTEVHGLTRCKDYHYGKTWITVFRKAKEV